MNHGSRIPSLIMKFFCHSTIKFLDATELLTLILQIPLIPKNSEKNGGGVLTATKADIAYKVKRVKVECKAELLAI